MDMAGQVRTTEADVAACQARCAGVDGCAYFTFWSGDGGCHLQDSNAVLQQSPGAYPTQYGPRSCTGSTPVPPPPPIVCIESSAGSMYAAAGSSGWSGMDMAGQSRSTEADVVACQARCAGVDGCAY